MSFFKLFRKNPDLTSTEDQLSVIHSLKRDGTDSLEFQGRLLGEYEWPWSENDRIDTDINCRLEIYKTNRDTWVAGQSRFNLQPMIRSLKEPDVVFKEAKEFDSLSVALEWIENSRLQGESFAKCVGYTAKKNNQYFVDSSVDD